MVVDPISPIAPARVRAILLPLGKIRKPRFDAFVRRLRVEHTVRLGDVSPDALAHKTAFSPLAFPNGLILYDLATTLPTASHAAQSPYETFREALVVLCIGDAAEYGNNKAESQGRDENEDAFDDDLVSSLETVSQQLPRALFVQPILFEAKSESNLFGLPPETILVPAQQEASSTSIKTVMCDVSARLLAELSTFARSIQELTYVPTPAGTTASIAPVTVKNSAPLSLLRTTSLRPDLGRMESPPLADDDQFSGMPALSEVVSAPADFQEDGESMPSSPRESIGHASPPDNRTRPSNVRQVSRDSSIDSLSRRDFSGETKKPPASNRRSLLLRKQIDPAEVAEQRLKARQTLVIGSLYLQAGRWPDALRELSDGVVHTRATDDHFWHAKGLENLLVTMLMLASCNMDFEIPQVCYATSLKNLPKRITSMTGQRVFGNVRPSLDASGAIASLASLIPELCVRILDIHIRGFSNVSEPLSRYAFSESIIRLAHLMSYLQRSGGMLSAQVLGDIVSDTRSIIKPGAAAQLQSPSKVEIADFLFRAFPPRSIPSPTTSTDTVLVLSGMSSVLGNLGLGRKQAIVNKELLTALVPAISQARKSIAASGLQLNLAIDSPDAISFDSGTQSTLSDTGLNLVALMDVTGRAYALTQHTEKTLGDSEATMNEDVAKNIVRDIFLNATLQSYGSLNVKLEMMHLYSSVAEAIPDSERVVQYAAAVLEIAGERTAPPVTKLRNKVLLPREEQFRHMAKLNDATMESRNELVNRKYWDSFMVRGITLCPLQPRRQLLPRPFQDLNLSSHAGNTAGPFLHDPFLKPVSTNSEDAILVANEYVEFDVCLQNLYDFDVVINHMSLLSDGVSFKQRSVSATLPPCRMHALKLRGKPMDSGMLKISGLKVKVRGCQEESMFLFNTPWSLEQDTKFKGHGVGTVIDLISSADQALLPQAVANIYEVLPEQPLLHIASTTFPQATISVLDGEARTFHITLTNESTTTSVDFVHITFQHSLLVTDTSSLSEVEQYETDFQRINHPVFRWVDGESAQALLIMPGKSQTYTIKLLANPGLQDCRVVIDYAHAGEVLDASKVYTRQVVLPLTFTANKSVEIESFDVIPLNPGHLEHGGRGPGAFLLVIDVRNSWMRPLSMSLHRQLDDASQEATSTGEILTTVVQPGQVSRLSIVLPRLWVDEPGAPIPNLTAGPGRQFIVNKTRRTSVVEMNNLEIFWYREELLKRVSLTWAELTGDRSGHISLRGITVRPRMLETIKKDAIVVGMTLISQEAPAQDMGIRVNVDDFLTAKLRFTNTTTKILNAFLQIELRSTLSSPEASDEDMSHSFAWTGQLSRSLKALGSNEELELEIGLAVLVAGDYTIDATVSGIDDDGSIAGKIGGTHRRLVAS